MLVCVGEQALSQSAVFGVVLGLCIALPVLILATMNLITGLFATLIIGCNTAAAIGVLPLANWKLDVRPGKHSASPTNKIQILCALFV